MDFMIWPNDYRCHVYHLKITNFDSTGGSIEHTVYK